MDEPKRPAGGRLQAPAKEVTALLPPFAGLTLAQIELPQDAAQCAAAVERILAAGVAGFDTEAKPTFAPGEASGGPHLLQFALVDRAYLFQPQRGDCQAALARLLESPALLKVGFGLQNDRSQIRARLGLDLQGLLDLDLVFRKQGYPKSASTSRRRRPPPTGPPARWTSASACMRPTTPTPRCACGRP
jgi:hypothetical protein